MSGARRTKLCGALAAAIAAIPLVFVWLVISIMVWGRPSDFERRLPNEYRVFASNTQTIAIVPPPSAFHTSRNVRGVAIGAKVVGVAVIGDHVIGLVESSPDSELAHLERPDYFILNTATHELLDGLDESSWHERLTHDLGRDAIPKLRRPYSLW